MENDVSIAKIQESPEADLRPLIHEIRGVQLQNSAQIMI